MMEFKLAQCASRGDTAVMQQSCTQYKMHFTDKPSAITHTKMKICIPRVKIFLMQIMQIITQKCTHSHITTIQVSKFQQMVYF